MDKKQEMKSRPSKEEREYDVILSSAFLSLMPEKPILLGLAQLPWRTRIGKHLIAVFWYAVYGIGYFPIHFDEWFELYVYLLKIKKLIWIPYNYKIKLIN